MTVADLIIYNSIFPAASGYTVLQHLQNIQVNREAVCQLDSNVLEYDLAIGVDSDIITGNILEDETAVEITVGSDVTTIDETLEVNVNG